MHRLEGTFPELDGAGATFTFESGVTGMRQDSLTQRSQTKLWNTGVNFDGTRVKAQVPSPSPLLRRRTKWSCLPKLWIYTADI